MSRITTELLRKRAEHNEGVLSNLEEISLHQLDIEKIENLDSNCREIKICLLQSNLISKMENLSKLKRLEYLNLALNNISKIEGIEGCENLRKLDFTVNFIDIEDIKDSIQCLTKCILLEDLYLTGNPCENWTNLRLYIAAKLPQLIRYNSKDILKSERIEGLQRLKELEDELIKLSIENIEKKKSQKVDPNTYSKESRVKMYKETSEARRKQEEARIVKPDPWYEDPKSGPTPIFNTDGSVRQCNEGKYKFKFDDYGPDEVIIELFVPKFMDTSLIKIDLNCKYIRIDVKGKITQFAFEGYDVEVDKSQVLRSQTTGALQIKCKKYKKDTKNQNDIILISHKPQEENPSKK